MPVVDQHVGEFDSNIAAPANQKKGFAHGKITAAFAFIPLFVGGEQCFKNQKW